MPQMAPIMWLPLFTLILLLLTMTKSAIYFIKGGPTVSASHSASFFNINWLW